MMFPDCRNDECYNEDFLSKTDKEYVSGADWMLEQIVNLFENNLDTYAGRLEYDGDIDIDKVLNKAKAEISEMVRDWAEMERNMLITSMIENMDDEELKENRKEAFKANREKEYYDTRRFMCTGVKERTEDTD